MLVDTHAHLDFPEFAGDVEAALGPGHIDRPQRLVETCARDRKRRCACQRARFERIELIIVIALPPSGVRPHRIRFARNAG